MFCTHCEWLGSQGCALGCCLRWEVDESALWVSHDLPSATTGDHPEVAGGLSAVPHHLPPVLEGGGAGRLHIELVAAPHSLLPRQRAMLNPLGEFGASEVSRQSGSHLTPGSEWLSLAFCGVRFQKLGEKC